MPATLLLLRLIHILFGAFWVGTLIFFAVFLEPTVRSLGPDAGKFMAALAGRKFPVYVLSSGILTVLSGIALFGIDSDGFRSAWMITRTSTALQVGGGAAILALLIGATFVRPTFQKLTAPGGAQLPEAPALRERLKIAGRVVASLLTISVICMAVARYL